MGTGIPVTGHVLHLDREADPTGGFFLQNPSNGMLRSQCFKLYIKKSQENSSKCWLEMLIRKKVKTQSWWVSWRFTFQTVGTQGCVLGNLPRLGAEECAMFTSGRRAEETPEQHHWSRGLQPQSHLSGEGAALLCPQTLGSILTPSVRRGLYSVHACMHMHLWVQVSVLVWRQREQRIETSSSENCHTHRDYKLSKSVSESRWALPGSQVFRASVSLRQPMATHGCFCDS